LAEIIDRLKSMPRLVGRPVGPNRELRRAYLPRLRYYLYFEILEDEDQVVLLGIWHGNRLPPSWER
jgi:plasmid stabilization system protein ParE